LSAWHLYLIECRNGAYYAGITNDIERRYAQHAAGKGAKYTRANPPVRLIGARAFADKSTALKAEHAIRQLPRNLKPRFLSAG
jgi:putative endonuclease